MSFSRTIRVFLSSTFRDFGEERDLLVKKVFPELRRMCRERQVELVDVDLRWGITEKEAQQGKVLPTCLAEIDRARPYFMGFIGDRYGWIPEGSQYPEVVVEREPWLEEHRGGKSVTELEMLHGVLNNPAMAGRAFFYFRDSAYSQAKGGDYAAESTEHAAKLEALRERLRQSEFPVVEDYPTPEALAERVREDLLKLIDEEYPKEEVPDPLTLERMRHESYGASRKRLFIGKEADIAALDEAMDRDADGFQPVLITGEAGIGKSALLANWMPGWQERHPSAVFVVHHVDASAEAADPVEMVKRLMHEVCTMTGDAMEAAGEPDEVLEQLPEVFANAARDAQQTGRSWVIILDGLESLSSHKHMRWFPRMVPTGGKLVVCCANGDTAESLSSRLDWARMEVTALRSERCREFITTYLGTFCKKLPEPLLERILGHPLSGHALWLRTLLEELRLFGKHEEVADRLDALLSAPPSKSEGEALTIDDLFEHVVSRIDLDTGGGHVAASLTALWASYDGLARSELLELTGMSPSKWAEIQTALDESLFESGGQVTLGNKFIRKAVADMYLPTVEVRQDTHRWLAEWFEGREVTLDVAQERVHHWKQAGDRAKLRSTLLEQEVFRALYAQDKFRLIGHWVELKENLEDVYQEAFEQWSDGEDVYWDLADLLAAAGFYGAFTESLYLRDLDDN